MLDSSTMCASASKIADLSRCDPGLGLLLLLLRR
jgi:hypothetical protein